MAGLRGKALIAYLLVCIVWGSTYLGIRISIQTMPPFFMAAARFLLPGGVLLLIVKLRGAPWPPSRVVASRACAARRASPVTGASATQTW